MVCSSRGILRVFLNLIELKNEGKSFLLNTGSTEYYKALNCIKYPIIGLELGGTGTNSVHF